MKLVWREFNHRPLVLYANMHHDNDAITPTGLREEMLVPVQQWCEETGCGRRISFDMFQFKNRADISAFLLKWG